MRAPEKQEITWYKPSEKMPKVGDEIIVIEGVLSYRAMEDRLSLHARDLFINALVFNNHNLTNYHYWTYARNLNLPKD